MNEIPLYSFGYWMMWSHKSHWKSIGMDCFAFILEYSDANLVPGAEPSNHRCSIFVRDYVTVQHIVNENRARLVRKWVDKRPPVTPQESRIFQIWRRTNAFSFARVKAHVSPMARRLERLKNADISGSSTSLDGLRGSSENGAAMNAIENVGFDGGMSENAYCELQHNGKGTDPNTYDSIGPKMRNQLNSKVSVQNSSKQRRRNRTRRYRVVKRVLIFLIMFVAIAAMLLSIMLMLGKLGPKCACRKSSK